MPLPIITPDARLATTPTVNIAIFGASGVGKTTLAATLDGPTTLFLDLEAGTLAIEDWLRSGGNELKIDTWEFARDLVCLLHGPNPSKRPTEYYSAAHYHQALANVGEEAIEQLSQFKTLFWDSLTVASRLCFDWALGQPEAISEKTGKPDTRGAYGLLGREMISWLTHIQHIRDRNVIVVGILDANKDDMGRKSYDPQIVGSMTEKALPGIFDEVITMSTFRTEGGEDYRALVCQSPNQWGYPAKDRSGRLDLLEEPHLGKLIAKIQNGARHTETQQAIPKNTAA